MSVADERAARARPVSPYKGLAPFEDSELDALLFFGRERERSVIGANLVAARLTVLYGPSGVGKTSILAAGVVRDLRALPEAPLVVVHTAWADDPVGALAGAVAAAAGVEAEGLGEAVELACALHGELYLVLDQVEEYFVYHGGDLALGDALADLCDRSELRVHVLIGVREDALARLDAFKSRLPGLLANRVRLDHLDREAGRRAIVGPIERFAELVPEEEGLAIEPALVEAVLDGVRAGAFVPESRGRGVAAAAASREHVETPYLQLVMQRLWEVERAEGSRVLRLATLERLGGPGRIVEEHLERALAALTPAQKQLAARMFNHLVTPSGTKIAHGTRDLAGYAAASEEELAPVLAALGRERILRPVGGNGAQSHEIYHDVLADAVLAWRGRFEAEQTLALVRRRHRRALVVAGVALVALALTAALAVFALAQRSQARSQRSQARAEARRAHGRELDAQALAVLGTDPQRALAYALRAARLAPSGQAADVLRTSLLKARLRKILPASGPVTSAAYSQDGRLILTASEDGNARIYDAASQRLLHTLDAGAPLAGAVFDRKARLVVTEGRDGARVWDVASGRPVATLPHHGAVLCAAFTQGGGLLVTGGADHTARVWRVGSWKPFAVLQHPGPVLGVDFDNDGSLLLTRSTDRYARLFETAHPRLVGRLDQTAAVTVALFAPNGKLIVTAGENARVRVWVVADGRLLHELRGHTGPVLAADITQRGNLLATGSRDGSARIWSLPDGRSVNVLNGHDNFVTGVRFSPDGYSLVTTSRDRTARVWKPDTGDIRAVLAGDSDSVTGAAFSPDGSAVVTASDDGQARVWDPQLQPPLRLLVDAHKALHGASYLAGGREIFLVGPGGTASVRDARSGKLVHPLHAGGTLTTGAASVDGSRVAAASGRTVTVWDARSGRAPLRLRARAAVTGLAFGPDGALAASGRGGVEVWPAGGKPGRVLAARSARLTHVAFSPDGSRLASSAADGVVRVWEARTGRLRLSWRAHRSAVTSVRFSPDGTKLVTASLDNDARTWNARTGAPLRVLRGHTAGVEDAEFSPDGRWVVTAGPETAGLWDARSGELLFFLRGHEDRLTSATFDPAGRRILTASVDGTARTYACELCGGLDTLVPLAERRLRVVG
ncbi:MAG: WD40 repeat domain-containing protein [Gaiellaceae bacterium]